MGLIHHRGLGGTAPGGFPCYLTDAQIQSYLASGATVDSVNQLCSSKCWNPLPGAPAPPGLPVCSQVPGGNTTNNPMIQGLMPGQPGYADALQVAVLAAQQNEAANPSQNYGSAQLQSQLTAYKVATAPTTKTPTKTTTTKPATTAATTALVATPQAGIVTQSQLQNAVSTPPANLATVPITTTTTSAGSFLTQTMLDGIPNWVLLAAVGLGAFLLMRGKL